MSTFAHLSRPEDRTGGGRAYRAASLVSAVMLAKIEPVKPFFDKRLSAHSEACGRTERAAHAQPRARATNHALHRRKPGPLLGKHIHWLKNNHSGTRCRPASGAKGAHMTVSAVSAEIVDGTLPTRPG
jgi:hypothetical protein